MDLLLNVWESSQLTLSAILLYITLYSNMYGLLNWTDVIFVESCSFLVPNEPKYLVSQVVQIEGARDCFGGWKHILYTQQQPAIPA